MNELERAQRVNERQPLRDEPRYPDVHVQLSGRDGNTGAIMGYVSDALKRAGHGDAVNEWRTAVMSAESYDEVLRLAMNWVEVS